MTELENKTIQDVRAMTDAEYEEQYWIKDNMGRARVIVLEDDTRLFASCDMEGNSDGFMEGIPRDESEIVGATITSVEQMSEAGAPSDWIMNAHRPAPPVMTLDTGHQLFPMEDPEGNGPGALFGVDGETDEPFVIIFQTNE